MLNALKTMAVGSILGLIGLGVIIYLTEPTTQTKVNPVQTTPSNNNNDVLRNLKIN